MSIYKLQKKIAGDGSPNEICAYEVDNAGEQIGIPRFIELDNESIKTLFQDKYLKVYCECEFKNEQFEINLDEPRLTDLWI